MRKIIDIINEIEEEILIADGFDDALIGVGHRCGQPPIAVYDRDKCIILMQSMALEEAEEFFEFNTVGAWVGDQTPIFVDTFREMR
jgi:hypothetical protein